MESSQEVAYMGLQDYMLPCMNKKLFGVECPGCGMQRSAALLFKGEFAEAFFMYPGIYPLLFLLLFILTSFVVDIRFERQIKIGLGILTGITIITSYIIKMNFIFN